MEVYHGYVKSKSDRSTMSHKNYDPPMHTTEHILNRTMDNIFKCGRSIGTHLEKKKSKCDYPLNRDLTPEEKKLIENTVNGVLAKNLEVKAIFLPPAEAAKLVNISKLPEGATDADIRIIQIGDYDNCACIGPHVVKTGDIKGRFKITSTSLEQNGICRIRWTCK